MNARGWTLLELMIVLAVMAILVALAYPAFNDQIIKARRADGKAMLLEAAQRQQQVRTATHSFTATIGDGGLDLPGTSSDGYYTLGVSDVTATTYTLTATRAGVQTADTRCGNLTLDHLGVKGVTNATQTAAQCW